METRTLEDALNEAKDMLNIPNYVKRVGETPHEKWIEELKNTVTSKYNAQYPTVAWLKCIEILQVPEVKNSILEVGYDVINVFDNAAFPGSFTYAINHFLRSNKKKMNWLISSYLPQPNTQDFLGGSLDDKYELRKNYKQNVIVGEIEVANPDGTSNIYWNNGDLTNPNMPDILSDIVTTAIGKVQLYTSDGGFDVSNNYNLQEILSIPLKFGEAKTGVLTLAENGKMILKFFTFFTPFMKSLIYCLADCFKSWLLFKPNTSSPINSEIYFIGLGFKDSKPFLINEPKNLDKDNIWYLPNQQNENYVNELLAQVTERQISVIKKFLANELLPENKAYPYPNKLLESEGLLTASSKGKGKEIKNSRKF